MARPHFVNPVGARALTLSDGASISEIVAHIRIGDQRRLFGLAVQCLTGRQWTARCDGEMIAVLFASAGPTPQSAEIGAFFPETPKNYDTAREQMRWLIRAASLTVELLAQDETFKSGVFCRASGYSGQRLARLMGFSAAPEIGADWFRRT